MSRRPTPREIQKRLRGMGTDTDTGEYPETLTLSAVSASTFDPEDPDAGEDNGDAVSTAGRIETDLESGETTVYNSDGEAVDTSSTDRPECSEDDCQNPRFADLDVCEKCAGMPAAEWRDGVE